MFITFTIFCVKLLAIFDHFNKITYSIISNVRLSNIWKYGSERFEEILQCFFYFTLNGSELENMSLIPSKAAFLNNYI